MPIRQFAVFGHPIAHSLSPVIHQAMARQFGIDLSFDAIDAAPVDFAAAVQAFFAGGGVGANVTLPHKAAALTLAAAASPAARRVGAANVLTRRADGSLAAHNTDGEGLVRDLVMRHGEDLRGRHALLLGAGGAASGVAWNLLDAGLERLVITNRSPAKAERLAAALGPAPRVATCAWEGLATAGSFDLIVNATSAGVLGQDLQLPLSLVGPQALCYDLSYGPAAAGFLAWAHAAGARRVHDGLGMLVETAAAAFALWHGRQVQTEPVYQALRADQHQAAAPQHR